ncbi:MAG: hemerythrin domain-containing protein [Gammaproteobacteria bacterium]|nr:hemerythrin domain-containing protein [Gammaproteobacteria bacterium]
MNGLEDIRGSHSELQTMIGDLKVMLKPELLKVKPHAETTHKLLCSLVTKTKEHLQGEDKGIYPPLLTQDDEKLKSMAWGFISGGKPLRKEFESYHQKWLKDCKFEFTQEFMAATEEIFSTIEERIEREKTVLIPKLEASGVFALQGA